MSRVFVATERKLARRVVIKVLSSEVAATLSTTRFEREIRLAASLQQANIVPLLSAGMLEDTPYYTMPFVEGESLRARLSRGLLAESETVSVLRDVARALVYAHERGVVHRDIKPDNVLLSGEAAVVTDFGIAKAITAARVSGATEATGAFTQVGTAIGTPAYMSPEQATGDPNTDHRADLYAFGCLAFELLTGNPPFHGMPPHKLIAAHMLETAPTLSSRLGAVSPELDTLVARCLAKAPEDRPANAREVLRQLESAVSGASRDAMPAALRHRQLSLPRAMGTWVFSFVAAYVLARAAVVGIGLPQWTVPLVIAVMSLGLPAVLVTWYVQRSARRAALATPQHTPGGTQMHSTMATLALRASPHVSWGRTWKAGAAAGALLVVAITVVMILRAFGVGPAASLLAAGRIGADSRVLVAEFSTTTSDTSLGMVVAQAMRTSIGQSSAVQLVSAQDVGPALRRMTLPTTTRLTEQTARELAAREGIPLIITGQVAAVGAGFMITASLVTADSGRVLATLQRGANGAGDLLDAIDHVARDLRARIGESLRSVALAPALQSATTSSLVALREYSRGVQAGDVEGDFSAGLMHLQAAVREDSTFAMAWRKIGVYSSNLGRPASESFTAASRAYRFRSRLGADESAEVETSWLHEFDWRAAIRAYQSAPSISQNNRALLLNQIGEYAAAESVVNAQISKDSVRGRTPIIQLWYNRLASQIGQNKLPEARRTVAEGRRRYQGTFFDERGEAEVAWLAGGIDSLDTSAEQLERSKQLSSRHLAAWVHAAVSGARGQLQAYGRLAAFTQIMADSAARNRDPVSAALSVIVPAAVHRSQQAKGIAQLDSLIAGRPQSQLPAIDRRDLEVAMAYAQLGRPDKAKPLIADFERAASREERLARWGDWRAALGEVALAEGRAGTALTEFRAAATADSGKLEPSWNGRTDARVARTFDKLGQTDSAIAGFARVIARRDLFTWAGAPLNLPIAYRRLGELYEAKGDTANAIAQYEAFARLWKDADPDLQPQVEEIRSRVQRLRQAESRKR